MMVFVTPACHPAHRCGVAFLKQSSSTVREGIQ